MRVKTKVSYSRRLKRGSSPAYYKAFRRGNEVIAHIWLHPILRKYKDLQEGILKHEMVEIKAWAGGSTAPHRKANKQEPEVTKSLGGAKGFWKEIAGREKI